MANYNQILKNANDFDATLVAVSKTKPNSAVIDLYDQGQRHFGENKVQELCAKYEELPKDIKWHFIGHLQRNKVKYIAPFVFLIHGVDSFRLLKEIDKQALKSNRTIDVLLQVHIAKEDTKFGFNESELFEMLSSDEFKQFKNINVIGLMGMATNTDDEAQIANEFTSLKQLKIKLKEEYFQQKEDFRVLSMGMSGDYNIALNCGSNMLRIGSLLFGARNYDK